METTRDQPTPTVSKKWLVEQIKICLRSSDYSRALELLRGAAAEFPDDNDAELSELDKLAHDGVKRNAEANRLITESQELFAQRKSAEAIQLLRQAYDLDKKNSLARSILANALVEHAHSLVDNDWLEAETLTNQALALNPAHPTAKTIHHLIVERKQNSPAEDWVARAHKLQSSGDLFAALAWVAEGLAVHPDDPKLVQIHDAIQRDQNARRRQARRGDLEALRLLQREIDAATDVAAKQALAVRIQTLAAKHWTDGEILSIANALLLRLGLVSPERSSALPPGKSAPVILHIPRPSVPAAPRGEASQDSPIETAPKPTSLSVISPSPASPNPIAAQNVPAVAVPPTTVQASKFPPSTVRSRKIPPSIVEPPKEPATAPASQLSPPQAASRPIAEPSAPAVRIASPPSQTVEPTRSNATTLILVSSAAVILVAATFVFTRKHYAPPVTQTRSATPAISAPVPSVPTVAAPADSDPSSSVPAAATSTPATPESSLPSLPHSSDAVLVKIAPPNQPAAGSGPNLGALVVIAGQDDAKVFLNGKLQRQLTRGGQLLLTNLEFKDYVVQVSKPGFQDPPQQNIYIRKGELAKLIFNLQPQPHLATLSIQGGAPGTTVLIDQALVGTIQPDGTLSVATVSPGDHTVELRKERFSARQFKKHFLTGEAISLGAADITMEALPSDLKINFTPADASVVVVKGDLLKIVSSGVPLNLAPGTYTLTARTIDRFTRSSTIEVIAGQSKTLDLSLAPNGMSKWDDPAAWKHEGDSFVRRGGDFVLYGVVPAPGTFAFSAMPAKGHILQWVFNYTDPKNYVLFQMDESSFSRTVIRHGEKRDQIIVPDKGDKKSFRTLQIRVSSTELVHQIKHGDRWIVLDRWTQPGANLSAGKFGFYIPGNDEVALSNFTHYGELNIR